MVKKIVPFDGGFPLSKAIMHDKKYAMEISGQIGINPETKKLEEGIEAQTSRAIELIKEILENSGWNLEDVIKTRIFLVDMDDYDKVNEVYSRYFSKDFPTRVVVGVMELPAGALIEIECTAARD